MGPFLFGQEWFAKFTLPIMKGSVTMMQIIIGVIIYAAVTGIMSMNKHEREQTQKDYDSTDWNVYYANL